MRRSFSVLAASVVAALLALAAAQDAPVLSGTVAGWALGESRLAAVSFTEDGPAGTIAETTVGPDGSFELTLPETVPDELLTRLDAAEICPEAPEGLTLSPESFMGVGVFALGVGEDEAMPGFLAQASSEAVVLEQEGSAQLGDFAVFYVYAAEPVSVRGTCVREGETETINLDLQAGWNTLVSSTTEVTDGMWTGMETTVGDAPEGAGWYYAPMPEGEGSEARFSVAGNALEGPAELSAGYHDFTVANGGEAGYNVVVLRLKEGATQDALIPAVEAVDQAFAGEGDPAEAFNRVLELADIYGEVYAESAAEGSVGMVLEPGSYLLVGNVETEEGAAPQNTYTTLEVTGDAQADTPAADQVVQMVDFAFALPPDIQAGEQVWQVVNAGEQLHHMVLLKLHEGKTVDDAMAWMESEEGPPPADEAGYVGVMSPGLSNYVTLELTPGEYFAICFMPDHAGEATGQPHFMLGMMQSFTVAGE
jgi:hypothetical protein